MCFLSPKHHSLVLPIIQCLKTVASYILSNFTVVCDGGGGNLVSVTLIRDIIKILSFFSERILFGCTAI